MKRLILLMILLTTHFGYASDFDPNGAWTNKEVYEYWKTGKAEEIGVRPITVGEETYLALTYPIVIDSYGTSVQKPFFLTVGRPWILLDLVQEKNNRYILKIKSKIKENIIGELYVNMVSANELYFEQKTINESFFKELDLSLLDFGKENMYVLCDKVK